MSIYEHVSHIRTNVLVNVLFGKDLVLVKKAQARDATECESKKVSEFVQKRVNRAMRERIFWIFDKPWHEWNLLRLKGVELFSHKVTNVTKISFTWTKGNEKLSLEFEHSIHSKRIVVLAVSASMCVKRGEKNIVQHQ